MAIRVVPQENLETPDNPITEIGIALPFIFPNVKMSRTTADSIRSNLANLFGTEKGERVMQPNLGVDLKKHLFNPISIDTTIAFKEDLEKQLKIWYPFLVIKNVDIYRRDDENMIKFEITFSYKKTPTMSESVQIEVDVGSSY